MAFDGRAYQALRDTGKEPTHADWLCIVERGKDGVDGRALSIRGTFDEERTQRARRRGAQWQFVRGKTR